MKVLLLPKLPLTSHVKVWYSEIEKVESANPWALAFDETLVLETFLKCGKLQCKSTFNRKYVCLLMIEHLKLTK